MALDNKTMISVVNKRSNPYTASLRNGEYYEWLPASDGWEDSVDLSFRDVQYLHTQSATFKEGYLFIDHEEARKRLGLEKPEAKVNQISKEDIEKALKGNIAQLKKMLESVANSGNTSLIREVVSVTKEIKVDNITKLQMISETTGVPVEVIIDQE